MRLRLRNLPSAWTVEGAGGGALEVAGPSGVTLRVEAARTLPIDWSRWIEACLGGAPREPVVESFTEPEGWSVTIVPVVAGEGDIRVHAFYAVFDQAVHAWAVIPPAASALVDQVRSVFTGAVPEWLESDGAIVALVDL